MASLGRQRLFVLCSRDCMELSIAFVLLLSLLSSTVLCQSSRADLLFNIIEEQSIGTYIGAITENQYLYKNLNSSQRKQLKYGLLDHGRYPASLFRVDESSGGIYVANRIDRESEACYQQPTCILEFNVALSSSKISFSNIATVLVTVADKNDNLPHFPAQQSGSIVLDISEFAPVGTVLKLSGAEDRDYDSNNIVQHYALTAYKSLFSIKSSPILDGSSVLDLTLLQQLDREVINSYHFSILAFDGGSPPLSAALAVQIRVTDENDNAPLFLNDIYNAEIGDEKKPGQVIIKVSASDYDSGEHGKVYYQFSRLQREQLEHTFRVDKVTGEISVMSEPSPGVHQFIVEALDGGSPPLKSHTVVRVKVISSKNNPPFLQINTLSNGSNSFLEVPEDAAMGAFVAFVTAKDYDKGARGDITCVLDSNVLRLKALAGKGFTLTMNRVLDRETCDSYNITVTCSDNGQPPLSTTKSVLVFVTDVNDNPPKFRWDTFSHIVPEGNYSNRHIIQVTATDPDMGKNAELIYSIDNSARPLFRIDPMSGIISATGQLDRETTPVYTFKVFAADRGQSQNTASANVIITLEDVNDQYPTFNKSIFEFRISENVQDRTLLGMLSAYDYDMGKNGKFEFTYTGSQNGADPFVVTTDGKIWTSGELDREQRDSYSFTVMVRDKGLPPKMTYASVVVTILDVNDNAPRIQFPLSTNHTIHVSTVPESGMVLAKIVAYDSDAAENGRLHFVLLYGNEGGAFDIDSSSGEIKVKDVSRLHDNRVYKLAVGVQDYGIPLQSSNTIILVDVNFDSSSGVLLGETEEEAEVVDYVMIVAAVAGAVVVLSAIIIVAVCFAFRQDRQNCGKHPTANNQAETVDDRELFPTTAAPFDNMSDDEKLRPCLKEESDEKKHEQTTSFIDDDEDDVGVKKKQSTITGIFRSSHRKKEVTFASTVSVADEGVPEAESQRLTAQDHNDGGNVSSEGSGEKANILKHPHHLLHRQQVHEGGSDVKDDTATNNSGHCASEDDVNIDNILNGERDRLGGSQVVTYSHLSMEKERYGKLPSQRTPKGDPHKPSRVDMHPPPLYDFVSDFHSERCRSATPAYKSVPTNHNTLPFPHSVQSSVNTSLFTPRLTRKGSCPSSVYKNVSFTPLSQQNPQRALSTFSLTSRSQTSFSTFQKGRSSSQQLGTAGDDDISTTTSGSYTVNPEELRMDGYVCSDITA